MLNEFVDFLIFSITGTFLGVITGLIPGFHTNNLALMLFSVSYGMNEMHAAVLISSAAISHTFLDIIPSTFLGVPEEDTALVILPAHSMLLNGQGYKAISLSANSSYFAILASFLFLIPFKFLISDLALYSILEKTMPFILICISIIVIFTSSNPRNAALIFLLSGLFGMVIFGMPRSLFPALAGLFGASAILLAKKEEIPEQKIGDEGKTNVKDIASGSVAGGLVAILPGVSSAIATTLALLLRKNKNDENAIAILSAANTATAFFVLAILFILLKARSGFAVVLQHMIPLYKWQSAPPQPMLILLSSILISATLSLYLTKFFGKIAAKNISRINYAVLMKFSLAFMVLLVIIFSGLYGLAIFIVATLIGMAGLKASVRRSNLMGVLLLPLIIYGLIQWFH